MDKKICIIILLFLILIVYLRRDNNVIEKMTVVEAFDRKKYLVRDLNDKNNSANLLAKLMENLKLLISTLKKRSENTMIKKLAEELYDASNNRGASIKKKEDTHKMAEANKAFAHFNTKKTKS